jgi:hypothetical protein
MISNPAAKDGKL